jgi:cobalt-zinc-cadmium resistance protein CzcA
MKLLWILLMAVSLSTSIHAQQTFTLQQAVAEALKNNLGIRASALEVESQRQLKKTSFDLPKTNVSLLYGQYNSYAKNDNNITVTQTIPLTVFGSQGSLNRAMITSSELKKAATENELIYQVKETFYELDYRMAMRDLLHQEDSIYEGSLKAAALRYKTGETSLLEHATAETQRNEIKNLLAKNEAEQFIVRSQLKTLLNSQELPHIVHTQTAEELSSGISPDTASIQANPSMAYMRQQVEVARGQKKVEAANAAPEILLGFFSQTLIGIEDTEGSGATASSGDRFTGFQVGLAIPLWFVSHQGKVKAAEYNRQAAESNFKYHQKSLQDQYQQAYQNYLKNRNNLVYYKNSALPNAELILKQSQVAFKMGEIGYVEYLLVVHRAITLKEEYALSLKEYNQSINYLEFLSGNK